MVSKDILLTQEGLEKLKEELENLKEKDRKEVINRIKIAKEFGDLSENSEYEDAKNEQAFIEGRIQDIEVMIKHSKIVSGVATGEAVGIGSTVEVVVDGDKETYFIVGPTESDPISGKISSESPVGRALIGGKKGDKVTVNTPDGAAVYKISSIK
ncbi:MAG: transcription elongation factor GreA [bacterium]|nr:transcription elongation factor GreA [bacterium]